MRDRWLIELTVLVYSDLRVLVVDFIARRQFSNWVHRDACQAKKVI